MTRRLRIYKNFCMDDWSQMDKFIASTHGGDHVLRNRPLFDWLFLRNADKKEANVLVAYDGDKLISMLGYMPTKFLWGCEVVSGAWMAHWITLSDYRNGVGALLMKKITEMFPVVAGQGASYMNQAIVTRMKFRFLDKLPKVVFIFDNKKIDNCFQMSFEKKNSPLPVEAINLPLSESTLSAETFNPDWSLYPSLKYGTLRDLAFMVHRYVNFPFFKYHIFLEGESTSPAVCIFRVIETNIGIRVARILEFFYPESASGRANAKTCINKCLAFFIERGCDYADFYCSGGEYMRFLSDMGFAEDNEGELPSLLDPIDFSRRHQNMEVWVTPDLKFRYPDCQDKFIVMRADGDQDRPNKSYQGE